MSPTPQTPNGTSPETKTKSTVMRSLVAASLATAMVAGPMAAVAANTLTLNATACYDVASAVVQAVNADGRSSTDVKNVAVSKADYEAFLAEAVANSGVESFTPDGTNGDVEAAIQASLTVADQADMAVTLKVIKVADTYYYTYNVAEDAAAVEETATGDDTVSTPISEALQEWADAQNTVFDFGADRQELDLSDVTLGSVAIPADAIQARYAAGQGASTGENTVTVEYVAGKDAVSGKADITYTVAPKDLTEDVEVTVVGGTEHTYTGSKITPDVTIRHKSTNKLIPATDYELSYGDEDANINAGTGTITITAKGDLEGCTLPSKNFTISPAPLSSVKGLDAKTVSFQKAAGLDFDLTFNGQEVDPEDYTITGMPNPMKPGDYKATITAKAGKNFTGSATVNVTVARPSLDDVEFSGVTSLTYNGSAQDMAACLAGATAEIPESEENAGDAVTLPSAAYEVESALQTDAGTYAVTVKPSWGSDWVGSKTVTVTMDKADIKSLDLIELTQAKKLTYNGKDQFSADSSDYVLSFRAGGQTIVEIPADQFTVKKANPADEFTDAGSHMVDVIINSRTAKNVSGFLENEEVTIDKLDLSTCTVKPLAPQPLGVVTTSNLPKVTLVDADDNEVDGTNLTAVYQSGDVSKVTDDGEDPVVMEIQGSANATGSIRAEFTIAHMELTEAQVEIDDIEFSNAEPAASAIKAATKVMLADTVVDPSDYTVSYASTKDDHVSVGTKAVNVQGVAGGKFENANLATSFKVIPYDLEAHSVTLDYAKATTLEYAFGTNAPAAEDFSIADPGLSLVDEDGVARGLDGTEYTLDIPSFDAAGEVKVTATGKGNFTGTIECAFQVDPLALRFEDDKTGVANAEIVVGSAALEDGKAEPVPVITVTLADGTRQVVDEDEVAANFDLEWKDNEAVGTGTVTLRQKAESKFALAAPANVNGYELTFEVTADETPGTDDSVIDVIAYRLYNPNDGDHFITESAAERDFLIEAGWNYEGFAWNTTATETKPLYRFYDPNTGEHFYTASSYEAEALKSTHWQYEGERVRIPANGETPVYRVKNPGANMFHHFTTGLAEYNMLRGIGWQDEGIAWYI